MAVLGTFGDIVFEVSDDVATTFDEFVHTAKGRWAVHEVMNGKPRAEFLGPGQNELTMIIRISSDFHENPRMVYEQIGTIIIQGRHASLILGEKAIGNGEWYIEENESHFKYIDGKSKVHFIEMNVTFKEYF